MVEVPVEKIVEVEKIVDRVVEVEVPVEKVIEVERVVDRVVEVEKPTKEPVKPVHQVISRPSIGPAGVYTEQKERPVVREHDRPQSTSRRFDRPVDRVGKSNLKRRETDEMWTTGGMETRERDYGVDRPVATGRRSHADDTYRSDYVKVPLHNKSVEKSSSGWFSGPASVFGLGKRVGETELEEDITATSERRAYRSDRRTTQVGSKKGQGFLGIRPSRRKDDLTRINGIGPSISKQLYALNITSYDQISALTEEQLNILQKEHFHEQDIRRQNWVNQARRLIKSKA